MGLSERIIFSMFQPISVEIKNCLRRPYTSFVISLGKHFLMSICKSAYVILYYYVLLLYTARIISSQICSNLCLFVLEGIKLCFFLVNIPFIIIYSTLLCSLVFTKTFFTCHYTNYYHCYFYLLLCAANFTNKLELVLCINSV